MTRIALVVHRFGQEICGGAELHTRLLANKLKSIYDVEVITTTALDDSNWHNYYPEGVFQEDGFLVRRFMVQNPRKYEREQKLPFLIGDSNHSYLDEIATLIDIGPYSPELFNFVRTNYGRYRAIIFVTYYYYQTSICSLGIPNAILLPTAHDEINIRMRHYNRLFKEANGFIFNTKEERDLIEFVINQKVSSPNVVAGVGFEIPDAETLKTLEDVNLKTANYISYVGRISEGKGCGELIRYITKYNKLNRRKISLRLVGSLQMSLPENDPYIQFVGFVDEEEKNKLIRNSLVVVQPSSHESLSMIVLEAMALKIPIMVNGNSPVLASHIKKSNGGFIYTDYESFERNLKYSVENSDQLYVYGENGQRYVAENYSWERVTQKICSVINDIDFIPKEIQPKEHLTEDGEVIPIVLASDNNYIKYLAVAVESIVSNINDKHKYEIIILSDGIDSKKIRVLKEAYGEISNVFIRYVECKDRLDKYVYNFHNQQLSRATFMRFLTLEMLPEYNKIVYVDCDTVVQDDIAKLYRCDISGNYIGAVIDPHIEVIRLYDEDVNNHILCNVKRTTPYFNAGVILMNLKEIRANYSTDSLLSLAASSSWRWEDQDILNYISDRKTIFLDRGWNVLWVDNAAIQNLMEMTSDYLLALNSPKIYHFAGGILPTKNENSPWAHVFWKVARKSVFYEDFLKEMAPSRTFFVKQEVPLANNAKIQKRIAKLKRSVKKRVEKIRFFVKSIRRM